MLKVPRPYFDGTPTTDEERAFLKRAGYIHITGLWCRTGSHADSASGYYVGEDLNPGNLGTWNDHGGESALVTVQGEVWIKNRDSVASVTAQLCPNGRGDYVVFRRNAHRPISAIIRRIADPNDGLTYVP